MKQMLGVVLVLTWLSGSAWSADEKAIAVVEKAIKAMGGQERFDKAQTIYFRSIRDFVAANGVRRTLSNQRTAQGIENSRFVSEMDANGIHVKSIAIISGDQGWAQIGRETVKLKPDAVRDAKRLELEGLLPTRPDLLKSKVFDLEWAGEQMVGDRPSVAIKVGGLGIVGTNIYFDRERGLPIKSEARFSSPRGDSTMQLVFSDYRKFDGIQVATKIECKTDVTGAAVTWVEHIKEFKILDKVPPDTFTEPK
jgi:hypothetical protein